MSRRARPFRLRRTGPHSPARLGPVQRLYLVLVLGFLLGPFLPLIVQSFAFRWAWPDLLPARWWLEQREVSPLPLAWDYVLSPYSRVGEALVNTLVIGLGAAALALLVCLPAARVLARRRFAGKTGAEFALALPLIVPEAAIGLALLMVYIRLGLAGSLGGIIVAHLIPTIPYMVRMLTAVWQGIGPAYEEQAQVLGASRWQVLRLVTLPMLMPGILTGVLFAFLVSSNIFLLTFLLGQGEVLTLPVLLFSKLSGGTIDASAAGLALVVCAPGFVMLLLAEGLLRGAGLARGFG